MRVLVTGGFGYLGAQAARRFGQRGDSVRVLSRTADGERAAWALDNGFEVVLADIFEAEELRGCCDGMDVVIHAAALSQPACADDPARGLAINALGTRNVLEEAALSGVGRFVLLSSIHVYGALAGGVVDESTPTRPVTDYGVTKLAAEGYCHEFAACAVRSVSILRPANGFGPPVFPSADCWMLAVNDFCRTAYRTGEIVLRTPGTQQRNFLALSDTVRAIETVADAAAGELTPAGRAAVLNVGAGVSLSIRELARVVAAVCEEVYGRPVAVSAPEGTEALPDDPPVDFRYERIAELGFAPATDLRSQIRVVAEYVAAIDG